MMMGDNNLEHDEMIDIHDNSANMVPQDGMLHPQNNFIHVAAVQSDQQYSQPQAADQQLQY